MYKSAPPGSRTPLFCLEGKYPTDGLVAPPCAACVTNSAQTVYTTSHLTQAQSKRASPHASLSVGSHCIADRVPWSPFTLTFHYCQPIGQGSITRRFGALLGWAGMVQVWCVCAHWCTLTPACMVLNLHAFARDGRRSKGMADRRAWRPPAARSSMYHAPRARKARGNPAGRRIHPCMQPASSPGKDIIGIVIHIGSRTSSMHSTRSRVARPPNRKKTPHLCLR